MMPSKKKVELIAAKNPAALPEGLTILFDKDIPTNRLLAKHPNASAELLKKLSHSSDKATRRAVTLNPNTDLETFVKLGQQFPKEFLTNPALDLLLLVNPGLIDQLPISMLVRLLKQEYCPVSLLNWASVHTNVKVQLAVMMNPKVSEDILENLRNSQYAAVTALFEAKPNAIEEDPEDAFEQAVRDRLGSLTNTLLREAWRHGDIGFAQWGALPLTYRLAQATDDYAFSPAAVARMLRDSSWSFDAIREALPNYEEWVSVAQLPIPEPILEALSKDSDSNVRCSVASNQASPARILEDLAKDAESYVRQEVATNQASPALILEALSKDSDSHVRRCVARNQASPVWILEDLAKDSDSNIRCDLALNRSTPAYILEDLAKDAESRVRKAVARNPATPALVLQTLAKDSDIDVIYELACNPSIPLTVIGLLAERSDIRVQHNLLSIPSVPLDIREQLLEKLALSEDESVLRAVANNPATPFYILKLLSRDKRERIRSAVSKNPSTSLDTLEVLATDPENWIRQGVAANPNASDSLLETLASESRNRIFVAKNPSASKSILDALSKDAEAIVRECVAKNYVSTPADLLAGLSTDNNSEVRAAVAANPNASPAMLIKLASDRVGEVAVASIRNPSTPLPALLALIANDVIKIRLALAEQAHRSSELCLALWQDANERVRHAVVCNLKLKQEVLEEMAQANCGEKLLAALLEHPNLSIKCVESIANKLLTTDATESPWYKLELAKVTEQVRTAASMSNVFFYCGKTPNKAVLAKRSLAPLMALCSGPFVEPSRIAKVVGSTDWLVRAAVARNTGTPENLLNKLTADTHPLVAALAKKAKLDQLNPISVGKDSYLKQVDLTRGVDEALKRIRKASAHNADLLFKLVTDATWSDQTTTNEIISVLHLDEKLKGDWRELEAWQIKLLQESMTKSTDTSLKLRLVKSASCLLDTMRLLAKDEDLDVILEVLRNPVFPLEERKSVVKSLSTLRGLKLSVLLTKSDVPVELTEIKAKSKDPRTRRMVASSLATPATVLGNLGCDSDSRVRTNVAGNPNTPANVLEALSRDSEVSVRRVIASRSTTPMDELGRADADTNKNVLSENALHSTTPVSVLTHDVLSRERQHCFQTWALRLQRAGQREICIREGRVPVPQLPIKQEDLLRALDWLGCVAASDDNKALTKASRSKDWMTRLGAALHPATSEGILRILRNDTDPDVARAAMSRKEVLLG